MSYSFKLKQLQEELSLSIVYAPEDYDERCVYTGEVNRPGMELVGYHKYFEPMRIQIIGNREFSYLLELSDVEKEAMLRPILSAQPPAVIFSGNLPPSRLFEEMAKQYKVPLLQSGETTSRLVARIVPYLNLQLAPRITRHGVLVDVYGEGLLLVGESGVGKSETALELVKRGHRFVADDQVEIRRVNDRELRGSAIKQLEYISEIRGVGIINVASLFGMGAVKPTKKIDLVVNLEPWSERTLSTDRLGLTKEYVEILGIKVPVCTIPVRQGRNLAVIIEIAAMNHRQKLIGNDATIDFFRNLGMSTDDLENQEEIIRIKALE